MRHTDILLWSAREIASMALPVEQEKHTENVWLSHPAESATEAISLALHSVSYPLWNTFSVCLSRSAESAAEATSLALHSVSHALKGRLNTDTSPQNFSTTFLENVWRKKLRKAQWQTWSRYFCHCAFLVLFRYAGCEKTWPNHSISISLALVTLPAVLHR